MVIAMRQHKSLIVLVSLFVLSSPIRAEVTLDGTLGHSGALPGPDYLIGAKLGQRHGGNLFHSFQNFNLNRHESATFSGPNSINNIINRVTGGNPSNIDGLIRSNIPNADMYFINPYGLVFGENARLDVQGGFHASTADTLRLRDGGQFNARYPNDSLLTIAPIAAFGFLTNTPAPITATDINFSVPRNKSLSLIGGNLLIDGKLPDFISEDKDAPYGGIPKIEFHSKLYAQSGQINLASIASQGEVIPTGNGLNLGTDTQGGQINVNNSEINVTGEGGGDIFIRGGEIVVSESFIESRTQGDNNGGVIDIKGNSLSFVDGGRVITTTYGKGQGSDIKLRADELVNFFGTSSLYSKKTSPGGSRIYVESLSEDEEAGDAGTLLIEAKNIYFAKASEIYAATRGKGKGGNVTLRADESVNFSGGNNLKSGNQIYVHTHQKKEGAGNAGNVLIEASDISFKDGASISTTTYGHGKGGDVTFRATGKVSFSGEEERKWYGSSIWVTSSSKSTGGKAGNIFIEAGELKLENGSYVTTTAFGPGDAGDIYIKTTGRITLEGASSGDGWGSWIGAGSNPKPGSNIGGNGGTLHIEAGELILKNGGHIASSSIAPEDREVQSTSGGDITIHVSGAVELSGVNPYGENEDGFGSNISVRSFGKNAGQAGTIVLTAGSLSIKDGAVITSSTSGIAPGGKIALHIDGTLYISGTSSGIELRGPLYSQDEYSQKRYSEQFPEPKNKISFSSIVASSSSEDNDAGNAGEISITANTIKINADGLINTATENAAGGNITLTTPNLLYLQNGNITTDVKGGESDGGNISIQNPVFVVLDGAKIISKAEFGFGGDIMIHSEQFLASADANNELNASSKILERSGKIIITAPDEDISGSLIILSTNPLNTDDLQKKRCEGLTRKDLNKLIVIDRDVPPITPDDQKTHYIRRPNAPKPVKPPHSSVAPEQLF